MEAVSDSAPSSPLSSLASSPLSFRSRSPTPPCDYPSPSLTLPSSRSPSKSRETPTATTDADEAPPKKKRKLAEQKPRTTEYLDLAEFGGRDMTRDDSDQCFQLQRLLKALRTKQKIVVIAGAGISVSAGIPDFRSSTGLFKTLRGQHGIKASGKHLFDAAVYKSDASTSSFHDMIRELSHLTKNAKPTPFHHMLATLAEEGRLLRLYTQNVDGIDTSLEPLATQVPLNPKGPWPRTIQLHGGLQKMVCTKCSELSDFNAALFDGPKPPACKSCEELENTRILFGSKRSTGIGRLRPRMVLYNEQHPEEDAIGAVTVSDLRQRPDAVVVVGTSLKIPSVRRMVREMCQVTRGRRDGFTAWINCGPEPVGNEFKDCWDLVVRGDCDDVARFASLPEWNDKDVGNYREASHEEWKRATGNTKVEVVVEPKHEVVEKLQGIPTPMPSPRHQSPVPMKTQPKITLKLLVNKSKAEPAAPAKKAKAASSAPKKKPAAKKIPAAKPAKITSMFGVTKAAKTVEKAVDKDKAVDMPATSFYNLLPKQISTPMLPVSPGEVRNNSDAHKHSFASVSDGDAATPASGDRLFTTPPPRSPDMKRETISPTGTIPKNMAHLIDTE